MFQRMPPHYKSSRRDRGGKTPKLNKLLEIFLLDSLKPALKWLFLSQYLTQAECQWYSLVFLRFLGMQECFASSCLVSVVRRTYRNYGLDAVQLSSVLLGIANEQIWSMVTVKLNLEAMPCKVCMCLTWCCDQIQIISLLCLDQQDRHGNLDTDLVSKVLHILPLVSTFPVDFGNLHEGISFRENGKKYSDHMEQDLQRLPLIKFWARHRCQIIGKTHMGLRFTEAPIRYLRDDTFCVLSRPITCHSPLTPSERKEGKGNLVLRSRWRVHKGQGSSRLSIDTLQAVWMTYHLHANSVSQLGIWLLGLLHDPESTFGKANANVTASNP